MHPTDLHSFDKATATGRTEMVRLGVAVLFLVGILIFASRDGLFDLPNGILLVAAAVIGGYMALNIGANDVANNVGPAVGSRALSIGWALVIAAIFESAGAIVAGGDVVGTVKKGIIDPALIGNTEEFIWLMSGALLAASIWLNLATWVGAPVSTTHAIVGGVLGAGLAAGGPSVADWGQLSAIVASWVISPLLGGLIAAGVLYSIKHFVTWQGERRIEAARRAVPILIAIMGWAFGTYLMLKGFKKIFPVSFLTALGIGLAVGLLVLLLSSIHVRKKSQGLDNSKESINRLFTLPLIFSAALLSFAHGANDVANAIGPLAAINEAVRSAQVVSMASIPFWIMLIGAIGISLGLALYGPKLIKVVGSEITEMNQMRAFSVALAAAITVIIASQLGLPVSSTHVTVGAVFGVGFLREAIKLRYSHTLESIREHHHVDGATDEVVDAYLQRFENASFFDQGLMLKELKGNTLQVSGLTRHERKALKKVHRHQLVTRSAIYRIVAAWLITVPLAAGLGAMFFFMMRGIMLD